MPQPFQPEFAVPLISYAGKRIRSHPRPWATDQGVPNDNDPNPDWGTLRIPEAKSHYKRVRPHNWKRGDGDEDVLSRCIYLISVAAVTNDGTGQTVYLKWDAHPVIYWLHTTEGPFTFTGNIPPSQSGAGLAAVAATNMTPTFPMTLTAWWNWSERTGGPSPDSSVFQIVNNGTCDIKVDGTLVAPGFDFTLSGFAEAPGAGDQSAFGGGTVFTVTLP